MGNAIAGSTWQAHRWNEHRSHRSTPERSRCRHRFR
jgi:hypothetical protein